MKTTRRLTVALIVLLFTMGTGVSHAAYVNNGNGTVTDTSTGLMWEVKTDDGSSRDKDNTYTWREALSYCETLDLGGHTDWRLPTIKELRSLVDYTQYNPAIDRNFFPNTVSSNYWSATTYAYDTS